MSADVDLAMGDPGKGGSILSSAELGMSPHFKFQGPRAPAVGESSRRRRSGSLLSFIPLDGSSGKIPRHCSVCSAAKVCHLLQLGICSIA